MHEIKTEIEINASPQRVWSVLLNFPDYPRWNPFIRSLQGEPKPGARLSVFIQPRGGKGMTFRPTVLLLAPNQELRWLGRLFLPGIFDGEHYFQIVQVRPDRAKFVQGERFTGVLVPFAKASLEDGTKAGFVAMNEALKILAETPPPLKSLVEDLPKNASGKNVREQDPR